MPAPGHPASPHFWPQFGLPGCPRFDGQRVLEIGCGQGERAFEIAAHGAAHVLGIDTLRHEIATASAHRDERHPEFARRVEFRHATIADLPDDAFDAIVSESAFEHIMDVAEVVAQIARKLVPGGSAYIAFGPLYHGPFGDHGWLRAVLPGAPRLSWPWGHLLLPQRVLLRRLQRLKGLPLYRHTHDWAYLDLNQLTFDEFERLFRGSGLLVRHLDTNVAFSRKGRAVRRATQVVARLLPALRKYLTFNMSVVLTRPVR